MSEVSNTANVLAAEVSERGRNPAVDPRDAIKPESGKPRSETSASSTPKRLLQLLGLLLMLEVTLIVVGVVWYPA